MVVLQLLASPFFGGPERQAIGVARRLPAPWRTVFASFAEGGKADDFLGRARSDGFDAVRLRTNWPDFLGTAREVAALAKDRGAKLILTHGYKPDLLGLAAARRAGIPVVAVAHGWTGATWKVRANEWLDARAMRFCDRVVGVSEKQSSRCRRAGVPRRKVVTIHNGVELAELGPRDGAIRSELGAIFPVRPEKVLLAAGRLSPEKGFDLLVETMRRLRGRCDGWGLVIFGGGPLEEELRRAIRAADLGDRVVLGGFRSDLDRVLPQADAFVLSSRTEGLPVALLEAMGSGVASVATAVGGTPEVITDGVEGLVVPPEDPGALAAALERVMTDQPLREGLARAGRERVAAAFTHEQQANRYAALFDEVLSERGSRLAARA